MDGSAAYLLAAAGLIAVAAAAAFAFRRLWSTDPASGLPPVSLLDLSPGSYAPVGRLFSARDLEFLRGQPGFAARDEAKFRHQRARVFRLYLKSMERDFSILHGLARTAAAQGETAQSDFSARLMTLPVAFRRTVWKARWQVLLFERGWAMPEISLEPAVEALEQLRRQFATPVST